MRKSLIYGVRNIVLIRNIRSVESARVRGNRSAKENTARQCIYEYEHREAVSGRNNT